MPHRRRRSGDPAEPDYLVALWPNDQQRVRLRAAVDHALSVDQDEGIRDRVVMAMAQVELYSCGDCDHAIELWQLAADGDDPAVAALAWLNLGLVQQQSAPITAVHAFEQAMRLGDTSIGGHAATELARLAERLGDNPVLARACQRALDLTSGDDRAQAALRLGRINDPAGQFVAESLLLVIRKRRAHS